MLICIFPRDNIVFYHCFDVNQYAKIIRHFQTVIGEVMLKIVY